MEEEKPFWEKQDYIRYLLKSNTPGPRLFRAKQAPEEEKDDDDDGGETEVKKVEKTPLEQLREIQDNIEFHYGMYGTELNLYNKEVEQKKPIIPAEVEDESETAGFLNQELLAYDEYLESKKKDAVHRAEFTTLLTTAAIDVSNKIESLKVASNWLESLGIDVADEQCIAPFSDKGNRSMETRHERDIALDDQVLEALSKLETHVLHVSAAGDYVIDAYFGWPGLPDGTKMPDALVDRFAALNIKLMSASKKRIAGSYAMIGGVGAGGGGGSKHERGEEGDNDVIVVEVNNSGALSLHPSNSRPATVKSREGRQLSPLPEGAVIEDLKNFTDAVEVLDDLYDRALAEGKGKFMPILMNRSKAQLLFCMQSCEKRIEEMAASIKNIVHHKQTIERIRRDVAVIKEQYLPAQEPVLHKKQADVQMQIKMAQALDEKMEMLVSKMESFDRQFKIVFEELHKNLNSALKGENSVKDAKEEVEEARQKFEKSGRLFKSVSQQSFFKDLQPRKTEGRRTKKK